MKHLARVVFLIASGVMLPGLGESQERLNDAAVQSPTVRRIAPPPVQQIPAGSATKSPAERRTMEAVRMTTSDTITLDGRLDEDVWSRAVPAANFIQVDPNNGQPATEQTEVRFVYDEDKLYMGVTMFD